MDSLDGWSLWVWLNGFSPLTQNLILAGVGLLMDFAILAVALPRFLQWLQDRRWKPMREALAKEVTNLTQHTLQFILESLEKIESCESFDAERGITRSITNKFYDKLEIIQIFSVAISPQDSIKIMRDINRSNTINDTVSITLNDIEKYVAESDIMISFYKNKSKSPAEYDFAIHRPVKGVYRSCLELSRAISPLANSDNSILYKDVIFQNASIINNLLRRLVDVIGIERASMIFEELTLWHERDPEMFPDKDNHERSFLAQLASEDSDYMEGNRLDFLKPYGA
tara:strand:+ start:11567 stop:12418 length:852 start_codon:yes stop_codon:yes gene_type:complete